MHLLIVGAGPGISGATARRLGAEGYAVGLVARREEALAAHGAELREEGIRTEWATAQSGDPVSLTSAVTTLVEALGPVDVLLYNVSVGRQAAVPDLTPEDLLADLAAGAVGLQTAVRAVLPGMRERGSGVIVNVSSIAGLVARPFGGAYSASKHALEALSESLYHEVRPFGIRIAVVEPGQFETDLLANATVAAGFDADSPYRASSERFDVAVRGLVADGKPAPAEVVAETIVAVAFDPDAGLRHLVGSDAELVMSVRRSGDFEHFDKTLRAALDWS